jgi:hypothetical protein
VRNAYERFEKELSFEDLLADSEASADLDALAAYASRVGATDAVGSLLINGHYEVFSNQWAHALQNVLGEQLSYLQEAVS